MDPIHPKRSPFFAARVIRLMTKTAAAQEIGTSAFALVCIVGMQEDTKAVRYGRPSSRPSNPISVVCVPRFDGDFAWAT